ncbi:MAG: transcriptional repressor LexA [Candidatus Eisenbacteria bacterium]|nr:transcriptional repressor LexA [Candidatus Eisenbacteria bacterium]MCC7143763.1 transcriptional repressor LexA [Candidatus Eisenbacteria bacterium]
MKKLTEKQQGILEFILQSINENGRFPSYREIGTAFDLNSVATVAQHLDALVQKGCLTREGRKLMPVRGLRHDLGIPVVGRVAAGQPISAIEHVEEHIHWDNFGDSDIFAVRVVGESMIEEGILDGDLVLVKPCETAQNNDLVVAYVGEDQDATVKRFRRFKTRVELHPANPLFRPIVIHLPDGWFRLAGKVVGVVRRVE